MFTEMNDDEWNYDKWLNELCVQIQRYLFKYLSYSDDSLYVESLKRGLKDYNLNDFKDSVMFTEFFFVIMIL